MGRARQWLLALACSGCAVAPYQPLRVECGELLPVGAFARCRALLLETYGALAVSEESGFRLQTQWAPHQVGDSPGQKRATVFQLEPGALGVVVEVRFLELGLLGTPAWTEIGGDHELERQLGDALAAALH